MKFLKHIETGQVMVWTEILSRHKKMRPYEMPAKEPAKEPEAPEPPASDAEVDPAGPAIDKDEAAELVHKLFGRDHSKVTMADMAEYAKAEFGVEIEQTKKLQMVAEIAAILKDRE